MNITELTIRLNPNAQPKGTKTKIQPACVGRERERESESESESERERERDLYFVSPRLSCYILQPLLVYTSRAINIAFNSTVNTLKWLCCMSGFPLPAFQWHFWWVITSMSIRLTQQLFPPEIQRHFSHWWCVDSSYAYSVPVSYLIQSILDLIKEIYLYISI